MWKIDEGQKQQNLRPSCSATTWWWGISGILTLFESAAKSVNLLRIDWPAQVHACRDLSCYDSERGQNWRLTPYPSLAVPCVQDPNCGDGQIRRMGIFPGKHTTSTVHMEIPSLKIYRGGETARELGERWIQRTRWWQSELYRLTARACARLCLRLSFVVELDLA
jgi:hypothetical protein